jgi:hypothetical protein
VSAACSNPRLIFSVYRSGGLIVRIQPRRQIVWLMLSCVIAGLIAPGVTALSGTPAAK